MSYTQNNSSYIEAASERRQQKCSLKYDGHNDLFTSCPNSASPVHRYSAHRS